MTAGSPAGGRLASGNQQLDAILGGGFPAHAINLVVGPPGSGKTILAQQYVFHNATPERPAVYLTTVSEPLEKVLRYGQTMAFFDPQAVGRAVFYEDVGGLLGTLTHASLPILNRLPQRSGRRCSTRMWVSCSAPKDSPGCWSGSTRWSRSAGPGCS